MNIINHILSELNAHIDGTKQITPAALRATIIEWRSAQIEQIVAEQVTADPALDLYKWLTDSRRMYNWQTFTKSDAGRGFPHGYRAGAGKRAREHVLNELVASGLLTLEGKLYTLVIPHE